MTIWLAYRVTPAMEFAVAEQALKLGASEVTVPSASVTIGRRRKGEPRIVKRPLAPGYVFAAYAGFAAWEAAWQPLRLVRGLHGPLYIGERLALLSPVDIRALRAMQVAAVEPVPVSSLRPADRIRIKRGRYAQISAIVERLDGATVVAFATLLGRPHRVIVPLDQVEAA